MDIKKDYEFLLSEVPKVYEEVTGCVLSKPFYKAKDVIKCYRDNVNTLVKYRIEDGLSDMVNDGLIEESVMNVILENFEKYI